MAHRLLMLGLDSIDWVLVNQWVAEGRLPVLGRLLAESRGLLFGESNRVLPGSVWTDIATGASASFHGFIHEEQVAMNSYRSEQVNASRVAVDPFYKTLNDAGVRCAVVDFPVDFPLRDFTGLQVIDWGTEFKLWRFETQPESFAAKLTETYGKHPLMNYPGTRTGLADLLELKKKLLRGIEIKREFAVDLLRRREHEFIFFNFAELHKAGHFFWKFHDRKHPEFTTAEPQLVDSLREMYESMDRAIGSVIAELGDNDELVVVTDRGMYAEHRGDHLVDDILLKLELAARRTTLNARASPESWRARLLTARWARRAYGFVGRRVLPSSVREALLPFHRAATGQAQPMDWTKTRVFRLPSVGNSYLRLNLSDREPAGLVAQGAEYENLLALIAEKFRVLVNPETSEPAVEDIYFPGKQFPGPRSAELPDVAIVWNSNAAINAVASADVGMIAGRQDSDRTGNHRPDGFALFRGASFAAGSGMQDGDARQMAPIILRHFGIAPPAHYEKSVPQSVVGVS